MSLEIISFALALAAPVTAEPVAPATPTKACCCKASDQPKMKCCDDMKAGEHDAGHDMADMDQK